MYMRKDKFYRIYCRSFWLPWSNKLAFIWFSARFVSNRLWLRILNWNFNLICDARRCWESVLRGIKCTGMEKKAIVWIGWQMQGRDFLWFILSRFENGWKECNKFKASSAGTFNRLHRWIFIYLTLHNRTQKSEILFCNFMRFYFQHHTETMRCHQMMEDDH